MRNEDVSHAGAAQMRLSEGRLERKRPKGPKLEKETDFRLRNGLLIRILLVFSVFARDIPLKIAPEQRPRARHPHFASSADEDVSRGNVT